MSKCKFCGERIIAGCKKGTDVYRCSVFKRRRAQSALPSQQPGYNDELERAATYAFAAVVDTLLDSKRDDVDSDRSYSGGGGGFGGGGADGEF